MVNHFDKIGKNYDQLAATMGEYNKWMLDNILKRASLKPEDIFVDLGGGTGKFTNLINTIVRFNKKPICVDPSKGMLDSEPLDNINYVNMSGDDFSKLNEEYDFILIKEAVHYLKDVNKTFKNFNRNLKEKGRILIVTRPKHTTLPFFKEAKDKFADSQPDKHHFINALQNSGFKVKFDILKRKEIISEENWASMIRGRFMSCFSSFTDEELEAKIQEINNEFSINGNINIEDEIIFIKGEKL